MFLKQILDNDVIILTITSQIVNWLKPNNTRNSEFNSDQDQQASQTESSDYPDYAYHDTGPATADREDVDGAGGTPHSDHVCIIRILTVGAFRYYVTLLRGKES